MRIVIIEDEAPALTRIKKLVTEIAPEVDIIATADSIEAAAYLFNTIENIELALMDIELADGQSFEIFNRAVVKCPVIFTTAYDEFALKAFKVNSIDYLLKPIDKEELKAAIDKFRVLHKASANTDYDARFKALLQELKADKKEHYKSRFLIKSGAKLVSVSTGDIAYFHAYDKMVYVITRQGQKYIIDHSLEEISKMLDPKAFFQVNRQFIASFPAIQSVHTYFNGKLKIELQPASTDEVIVSRERAGEFKDWLSK
jgi:two-component system response regulator LytT